MPADLTLFAVVRLDSRPVAGLSYTGRRGLLEGLGPAGPAWSTPATVVGHGAQAWEVARDAGLEGLLAKRLSSRYEPGSGSPEPRERRTTTTRTGGMTNRRDEADQDHPVVFRCRWTIAFRL
ncbi:MULTISPECIES: hypothetical protein [Streptomyces]|uniref:hypothetical protein n=1 Tax=Streptomyces TaxID=1883 RepID=UPI00093DE586|nr:MULTISPECIES: hypothetical protein [unclassified Streptomyces]OKJ06308.1 hypothetical protein AMK20_28780 [Streptomyces sp. TSRI0261]QNQ36034.1 hypothetical protein HYC88_21765 [Streptomyces sp. CB00271]